MTIYSTGRYVTADDIVGEAHRSMSVSGIEEGVKKLWGVRGATADHYRDLLELAVRSKQAPGLSALLSAFLRGERGAPGLDELYVGIDALAVDAAGELRGSASIQLGRLLIEGILSFGVLGAGRLRTRNLAELIEREASPFTEPFGWGSEPVLHISREAEQLLDRDGWWPVLGHCELSERGFDRLCTRVVGVLPLALLHVASNPRRMERVLAGRNGITLELSFLTRHHTWLREQPELWERMIEACEAEVWTLSLVAGRALGESWDWTWVRPAWLSGLSESAARHVVSNVGSLDWLAGDVDRGGRRAVELMLENVTGLASAALIRGGTLTQHMAQELLVTRFGDSAELARGLLSPATSLVELAVVLEALATLDSPTDTR